MRSSFKFQLASRIPHFAILLVFGLMLLISWRRWTSALVDSGREMDLPRRLLEGEWLYRDVHYIYPPLSPYFNALLYGLFGVHHDVLVASGVICALVIVVLCYRIARRLLAPSEASVAVILTMILCVFKPAGTLIFPYAFAALHGMTLSLGALLFTLRYSEGERRRDLLITGALLGLAGITKQEFALVAAMTVTAALIYLYRDEFRRLAVGLSLAAAVALAIAAPVYGLFLSRVGWRTLVEDCHLLYTHLPASLIFYNAHRTGLGQPISSLVQMFGGAAVMVAVMSAITLLSALMAQRQSPSESSTATRKLRHCSLIALLVSILCAIIVRAIVQQQWDGSPLRALPLLLPGLIVLNWRRSEALGAQVGGTGRVLRNEAPGYNPRSKSGNPNLNPDLFIIAVYSLAVLSRVVLRVPSGGAFGSFFLPTSLIVSYYLMVEAWPQWLSQRLGDANLGRWARLIGRSLIIVMLVVAALIFAIRYRRDYTFEIIARHGHLFTTHQVGQAMREALDFIEAHTVVGEAMAVLPEGSSITFLSGRRHQLRHQIFIPGLMSEADEREAIACLQQRRVRYVLLVNRPMREFGAESFGRDYYSTLDNWIAQHYRLARVCGPADGAQLQIGDPAFFIKILVRLDEAATANVLNCRSRELS